jgi:hypothetical protein
MKKMLVLFCAVAALSALAFAQCEFPYTLVDQGNLDQCGYPTLPNNPGHGLSGVAWLGPTVTGEGAPHVFTTRDCCSRELGDRTIDPGTDGVAFFGVPWTPCSMVSVLVQVTAGPNYGAYVQCGGHLYLNAWKDGNLNGNFDDVLCNGQAPEWIVQDQEVTPGIHLFTFRDPGDFEHGIYDGIFRFRLTHQPVGQYGYGLMDPACPNMAHGSFGLDYLGEVEDYVLCDIQLNVELTSFDATAGSNSIQLNWATASEMINDHFEVQRDGIVIAQIPGHGTSESNHTYTYSDAGLTPGTIYNYKLISVDINGHRSDLGTVTSTPKAQAGAVTEYALSQNYPNPFNPSTQISFDVKQAGFVTLKVYNMVGQEVASLVNGSMSQGHHAVTFNAANLPSGLYVYRMEAPGFTDTRKMLLMK